MLKVSSDREIALCPGNKFN